MNGASDQATALSVEVEDGFVELLRLISAEARKLEQSVRGMTPQVSELYRAEFPETNANLMLAVRALEEAQFRLGLAGQRARGR